MNYNGFFFILFLSCNFHNNAVVTFFFPLPPILFNPSSTVSAFATEKEIYICSKKSRCVFLCMSIFTHMHITDGFSCCYLLVYFNHSIFTWENKACKGKSALKQGLEKWGTQSRGCHFSSFNWRQLHLRAETWC